MNSGPSQQSKLLLKQIREKGNLKKKDFEKILELDDKDQDFVISHISENRKNMLVKLLSVVKLPEKDQEDESFDFTLSRRQSNVQSSMVQNS